MDNDMKSVVEKAAKEALREYEHVMKFAPRDSKMISQTIYLCQDRHEYVIETPQANLITVTITETKK